MRAIDVLRGIAVVGMVLAHVARVVPAATGGSRLRGIISPVEPVIASAFLFLVGWSLSRSWERASQSETPAPFAAWYQDSLKRAGCLYATGMVLFLLQYGPQFPDGVLSPDILATIAVAIVLVGAFEPFRPAACLWGAAAVVFVAWGVERASAEVAGVNAGPGGSVPLVALAFFGAWMGKRLPAPRGRAALGVVVIAAVAALVATMSPGPATTQHLSEYTNWSPTFPPDMRVWFWNHTPKGIGLYGSGVVLGFAVLSAGFAGAAGSMLVPLTRPIAMLGRHALIVYVGHLLALGIIDRWRRPPSGEIGLLVLALGLLAGFLVVLMLVESDLGRWGQGAIRRRFGLRI